MRKLPLHLTALWLTILALTSPLLAQEEQAAYQEFSLDITGNYQFFVKKGLQPEQKRSFLSVALQPAYFVEWQDGKHRFQFTGFGRLENNNSERSHVDLRELYWHTIENQWEISLGFKRVFWGVTESVHFIDIINQTDILEGFSGEDKLGQPMIQVSIPTKIGVFDYFQLLYFRKRAFLGASNRFRTPFVPNTLQLPDFEDTAAEWRPDFAIRWSHTFNQFDIGLAHFYGISREPIFVRQRGKLLYAIMNQSSIDALYLIGAIQLKMEAFHRKSRYENFVGLAAGFEYTFRNIKATGIDLGLLGEYSYDSRKELSTTIFNRDIFIGTRLAFNDFQNTNILFGGLVDVSNKGRVWRLEGSRRMSDTTKLEVEFRFFNKIAAADILAFFQNDSYVQVRFLKFL